MKAKYFITDIKNRCLMQEYPIDIKTDTSHEEDEIIAVYSDVRYQKFNGIGGAFTESSAKCFSSLSDDKKEELLNSYFTSEGNSYSFGRCHIASCDFSDNEYTNINEDSSSLADFSIKRDKKYIIPFIKAALSKADIKLFASPWSPPAFMKDNNSRFNGGHLKKEYYDMWSDYFVKFIEAYKKEGIEISAVTVQNEAMAVQTWESCVYTAEEEADFIKSSLGEKMAKMGVDIYIWDHNKESLYKRARAVFGDSEASKYVKGIACHWYSGDHFEQLNMVKTMFPDKDIIFSEGCASSSEKGVKIKDGLSFGERYAREIINLYKEGLSSFCDWNLILDEENGPFHNRISPDFCDAPIIVNQKTGEIIKEPSYYYIGHISRFVKPGAVRIGASSYTEDVEVLAFQNPDGSIALIALNRSDCDRRMRIIADDTKSTVISKSHSIITVIIEK